MKSANPIRTTNLKRKSSSKIPKREILIYENSKVVSPSHGLSPYASFRKSFKKGSTLISRCESTEDTRKSTATNASHLSLKKHEKENKARVSVHPQFSSCVMTPKNYFSVQNENELIKSRNHFKFMYQIGFGGFGKVWKVQEKNSWDYYAMKEIQKRKVIDKDSVDCILNERKVLSSLNHPFLVNIKWAFQDQENLYLILDYLKGADLRYHICYRENFTEEEAKFILACLILAVEEIHGKGIVHRDIKPENLVLEESGYVRLTDFGIAKYVKELNVDKFDSSGTPGYMAPEVLMRKRYNEVSDYFAIGVMGYELMTGNRPYVGKNRKEIKEKILAEQKFIDEKELPNNWSWESADFVNKLLIKNPEERLGSAQGVKSLKEHPWMKGMNWKKLLKKEIVPPFTPYIVCETKEYLDEIQSYNEMNEEEEGKICAPLSIEENLLFEAYSTDSSSCLATPFRNVRNTLQKNQLKGQSKSKKWLKMS